MARPQGLISPSRYHPPCGCSSWPRRPVSGIWDGSFRHRVRCRTRTQHVQRVKHFLAPSSYSVCLTLFFGFSYEYNGRLLKVHYDKFMPSIGQSMTAPSSPLLTSPFPGVSAASLTSIANVTLRPTSSHGTPLSAAQPLEYNTYGMHYVKVSTPPPPMGALSSLPRAQPQAVLPRLGTLSEQQLLARFPSGPSVDDAMSMNATPIKYESPPTVNGDLPTPPSSSAGAQSVRGSRVPSPPLQLPQPIHSYSQPSLKQTPPPPLQQLHAKSAPPPLTLSSPPAQAQPESPYSSQAPVSSSSQKDGSPPDQASRQRAQAHPAHPGPISLPPPSAFVIPALPKFSPVSPMFAPPGILVSPLHHPGVLPPAASHVPAHSPLRHPMHSHVQSPLHHPAQGHPLNMTPNGLPPITPSMPSFQFVPGPPPPTYPTHPPPIFPPGPPSTMSPGAFWGRPGGNTLTNAAVGAPVTKGQSEEEIDYFASASTADNVGEGYFPSLPQAGSNLSYEILREEPESASGGSSESQGASDRRASENGPEREEVSSNSGSSGRSSANERIGIDGVVERLHGGMHISLHGPGGTPRSEVQRYARGNGESLPPSLRPPPTRRKVLGPVQEQVTRNHNLSFTGLVQDAGSQSN